MIFNDIDIINESKESLIYDFAKNHIFGFERFPINGELPEKNNGIYFSTIYYKIKTDNDKILKWSRYGISDKNICYIPSYVGWSHNGKIILNKLSGVLKNNNKLVIYDYDGDNIDWVEFGCDLCANDIVTINCPNLKQYKGMDIFYSVDKKDIL